jgi:hypothetical protein
MSKNGYNAELPRRYLAMTGPSTALYDYNKYWAECFGTAPQLPMSRAEMDALAWDSCDIIIITGDAYVDHPSFGMAIIGRLLESQGFRVGIIAQPDWRTKDAFQQLGRPNLYFGVAAGNMDSMINRYTADKKVRNSALTVVHSSIRSAARKRMATYRSSSAVLKHPFAESLISTIGRAPYGVRFYSMPVLISCSMAMPNARSWKCLTASLAATVSKI